MATYYSRAVSKSKTALQTEGAHPARTIEKGVYPVTVSFTTSTALGVSDVVQMIPVQAGTTVLDVILSCDDLDSGTTMVLDVGDGGVTDRYIDGATIGQAGGITRMNVGAGHGYTYTANDTIDVLVQVGPAGDGAGTLVLTAYLSREPAIA